MIPAGQGSDQEKEILAALLRCRDRHQWSWNLSKRLINMYYGTQYTEKELKALYRNAQNHPIS